MTDKSEGLCWKCKDKLFHESIGLLDGMTVPMFLENQPYLHCHHEPKEKPKCWCETVDPDELTKSRYIGTLRASGSYFQIVYCPQCGKKL